MARKNWRLRKGRPLAKLNPVPFVGPSVGPPGREFVNPYSDHMKVFGEFVGRAAAAVGSYAAAVTAGVMRVADELRDTPIVFQHDIVDAYGRAVAARLGQQIMNPVPRFVVEGYEYGDCVRVINLKQYFFHGPGDKTGTPVLGLSDDTTAAAPLLKFADGHFSGGSPPARGRRYVSLYAAGGAYAYRDLLHNATHFVADLGGGRALTIDYLFEGRRVWLSFRSPRPDRPGAWPPPPNGLYCFDGKVAAFSRQIVAGEPFGVLLDFVQENVSMPASAWDDFWSMRGETM